MTVVVRLPSALREYAGGASRLEIDGLTIGEVLTALDQSHPAVGRRVLDEQGVIRRHVHVYIGADRVRTMDDAVPPGEDVTILPAVSGGCGELVGVQGVEP